MESWNWMKEVSEETNGSKTIGTVSKEKEALFVEAIGMVGALSLGKIGYILNLYIIL
jgi:hypothetical protein